MTTERKSDIFSMLAAAGVIFVGGTMLWDRRGDIAAWLTRAIDAVSEALTIIRHGGQMEDLQAAIDTLRAAGIGVPDDIERIVTDPRDGDYRPAVNLAMARGYLEQALRSLQEAQSQAESDGKSASCGAHFVYR